MRAFVVDFARGHSPRDLSSKAHGAIVDGKGHALRDKSDSARRKTAAALVPEIRYAARSQSWVLGGLHSNLS